MEKAKVFFTRTITPEKVIELYEALGKPLPGKVAVKVHSGEDGNQNYLRPAFMKPMVEHVNGTIVECNTAYGGERNSTEKHIRLLKKHGWNDLFDVDLMDREPEDIEIAIPNGRVIKKDYLGKTIKNYDSMLVLSHFKGHPMGGFGGALKQLSIGCASTAGKSYIHSAGKYTDQDLVWDDLPEQDLFLESMADAAGGVVDFFKGNMAFVSIMCNLSVDCDCCAVAEDPCMRDIGILSSLDPVALDQACVDRIYAANDPGKAHFIERMESRHAIHTVEAAAALGFGTREYELISLD